MKLQQVWTPYWEWEDWINGMWSPASTEQQLADAILFTSDWEQYGEAMRAVAQAWPRTMLNSLTNPSINKRAFLGHCAVCYHLQIPEHVTRQAWKHLTDQQRSDADKIAQKTIDEWKEAYVVTLKNGNGAVTAKDYRTNRPMVL